MRAASLSTAEREKRRAALISVLAVLLLLGLKVTVGLITGSLGVLAQAADSVLDMAASVLAFFAVRAADRPPDAEHPYGHGKVENLTALAETLLLLVTCAWIVYEAIQRLFFRPVTIEADVWGIGVMLLSIVTSIGLSVYLMGVARRQRSQSLEGNALNFRTDVLSSSVVLLGLGLVWLSQRLGPEWAWLGKADSVAALLVTLLVLRVSLQLGRRAVGELLDESPPGLAERIAVEARSVPGVLSVQALRARQSGAAAFVDIAVGVDRSTSLEEAHCIASRVEGRVLILVPEGDVVVHVDPVADEAETLVQTVGAVAAQLGAQVHNVHALDVRGNLHVSLHLEVDDSLTLDAAHALADRFEVALRREIPALTEISTHLEPRGIPVHSAPPTGATVAEVQALVRQAALEVSGMRNCHDVQLRAGPDGLYVSMHCLADADLPIAEAHRLSDQVERRIVARLPGVAQVLVHVEPEKRDA